MRLRAGLVALFLLLSENAFATTVTFQQGTDSYAGAKDVRIYSGTTNQSTTAASIRISEETQALFYFDISSIPSTATVNTATLTMYLKEVSNCTTEVVGVRKIEDPDATGAFDANTVAADAFNDYATWAYKDHGATQDWDSVNSNDVSDVDDNADEDTATASACPAGYSAYTWDIPVMVQDWVTNPSSNAGYMAVCTTACGVEVETRFASTTSERPKLVVDYTDAGGGSASKVIFMD